MQRRGLPAAQRREVLRCAVPLVVSEFKARITRIQFLHHGVAAGFGQEGSGADGAHLGVAIEDGFKRAAEIQIAHARQLITVYLDVRRTYRQSQQGATHCQERSAQDVETVDFVAVSPGDGPRQRTLADDRREPLALLGSQRLGIVGAMDAAIGVQDDGSGDYGPCERSPARFINTCTANALAPSLVDNLHARSSRIAPAARSAPPRRKTSCTERNSRVSSATC